MKFNFDNERPIYIQLVEHLRIFIVSGVFKKGEKIPSVRDLALIAKVNPNTMQKALMELEEENLIYTERTNGKYVTDDEKLLERAKKLLAKDIVKRYISDMKSIGIGYVDMVKYLEEIGGRKWIY